MAKQKSHNRAPVKKKKKYNLKWKQGQTIKEEFRNIARRCRDGVTKTKGQLEQRHSRDIKDSTKSF